MERNKTLNNNAIGYIGNWHIVGMSMAHKSFKTFSIYLTVVSINKPWEECFDSVMQFEKLHFAVHEMSRLIAMRWLLMLADGEQRDQ